MADQMISCPHCGKRFAVTKALTKKIEQSLKEQYSKEANEREKNLKSEYEKKLASELKQIEDKALANAERSVRKEYDKKLKLETSIVKNEAEKSFSAKIDDLKNKIMKRDKELEGVRKMKEDLDRRETELEERKKEFKSEFDKRIEAEKNKLKKEVTEKLENEHHAESLRISKERDDFKKQVLVLKRKLDQTPSQLQGEVYELHLEKILRDSFKDDEIEEVPKGRKGADLIQKVYSNSGIYSGKIIYESKDVKNWSKSWLTKLRSDQRKEKANFAILVSTVLPKDFKQRFGRIDGIWVTDFLHVIPLAVALRANLTEIASLKIASENKEEKLEVIYNYLTGVEFKQRVEAIVEAFVTMQEDLNKEKMQAEKNWAKRQRQVDTVLRNFAGMYGDFQSVVGKTLPKIKPLEIKA
jgi:hypothetical protein